MSSSSTSVLLLLFPGFNTLDLNGPLEIISNAGFSITIAAKDDLTTAHEQAILKRHKSLADVKKCLDEFDVLIVPGAWLERITPHLRPNDPHIREFLDIVSTFAKLGPSGRSGAGERVLLSICTGALFLGYLGVFDGLSATTHHKGIGKLNELCADYKKRTPGARGADIVPNTPAQPSRYVDAGRNACNVRIISSGGISSGLDATLYLVSKRKGKPAALEVAELMEYTWREVESNVH